MLTFRRAAAASADIACRVVGRPRTVRAARFVLRRARLDIANDMASNGELSLQRWALDATQADERIHIADVGANVGRWSAAMLATARLRGRSISLDLHAFEPSAHTFGVLQCRLEGTPAHLNHMALGDREGPADMYIVAAGAGRNSLYDDVRARSETVTEQITMTTLDSYAEVTAIDRFALVKIDTEGHDLAVLRGAEGLLRGQQIAIVQFEYNYRWIDARAYLRDAFEVVSRFGYDLGKLTPKGIEFYPGWDPELETFVEGNYVACTPEIRGILPEVRWWKTPELQVHGSIKEAPCASA